MSDWTERQSDSSLWSLPSHSCLMQIDMSRETLDAFDVLRGDEDFILLRTPKDLGSLKMSASWLVFDYIRNCPKVHF